MTTLHPEQVIAQFSCSCAPDSNLCVEHEQAVCQQCGRRYPIRDGILEFVDPAGLDDEKARELAGNSYTKFTPEFIRKMASKDSWGAYHCHFHDLKIRHLLRYLNRLGDTPLASLGSGSGFELKMILKQRHFRRVFSSDLSYQNVQIVPYSLEAVNTEVCLFTSDLDACPLKDRELPILIYEALHHTPDMHATLERLLRYGYTNIFFVEPTGNWLVRALARLGLAQRVEYSGVKPGLLRLDRLRQLCREYGYQASITAVLEFPEDYFRKICPKDGAWQSFLLGCMDLMSLLLRPFNFGYMTIGHLRKRVVP
jgi:uncharacterized protein YbaR (Trm112 family)